MMLYYRALWKGKDLTEMTKDVLVKISGLQFEEQEENEPVEIITTEIIIRKTENITFSTMKCRKAVTM